MPLPTCICVAGRPPFERLGDIFCALSQIDLECVIPTLLSATIGTTGETITLVFDQEVTGTGAGFTITLDSGNSFLTYASGDGTTTLVFTIEPDALEGEVAQLFYDDTVGDVQSGPECPLASFNDFAVTNNTGQVFFYLRPGGVDGYFRPGGVDTYIRP